MQLQGRINLLILVVCGTLLYTNAQCVQPNCFDCKTCNKDCTAAALKQSCDSDCLVSVRKFLCQMENENCVKTYGCDIPPAAVTIFPASYYDESKAEWKSQTIEARKNCCYKLSGIYDNTLTGLKNSGVCVQLFDGYDCTGTSLTVDSTWSAECLQWIDCASRLKAGGQAFNDKTSSFKLC